MDKNCFLCSLLCSCAHVFPHHWWHQIQKATNINWHLTKLLLMLHCCLYRRKSLKHWDDCKSQNFLYITPSYSFCEKYHYSLGRMDVIKALKILALPRRGGGSDPFQCSAIVALELSQCWCCSAIYSSICSCVKAWSYEDMSCPCHVVGIWSDYCDPVA